ncbi:MAG TPA: hypothetical protein VJ965_12870, partial [Anaerolineales bacterium]|nr:hypothetical protein [Anaerolineales bacterium]
GLDAAQLVANSYYKPYFFERVTVTAADLVGIVQADLARLADAPQDKKGVVLAFRIRKGVVSTMTESYCPIRPWHYPPVTRLGAVKTSADPAVIGDIRSHLETILTILKQAV